VTICTQDRQHVFGEVVDGEMRLNDAGRMALSEWEALPRRFPTIDLDAFVIMPNHVHGIIVITQTPIGATTGATTRVAPTVGDVVGAFKSKSITTVLYTRGVKQSGWPPFVGRLWQRNDYEHIIRDERESERIRTSRIRSNERVWSKPAVSDGQKPIAFPIKRRRFPLVRSAWGANRPFPTTLRWTLLPAG
jgi:putative transposase